MIKSSTLLTTAMALVCLAFAPDSLPAQVTKKKTEPITGTVVSIEKAKVGKSYTLKMKTDDDTEYDVPIVPKTLLTVTAKSDVGMLKPGMTIEGVVDEVDENLFFSDKIAICVGVPFVAQLTPIQSPDPDSAKFQMTGKVGAVKLDANGEGGHDINVQTAGRVIKIEYYSDDPLSLKLADPAFIKEGDAVEVDGTIIKSRKQITARTVAVTSAEPIASVDYFAAIEDSKKSKTSKSAAKSKSKTEARSEGEPETPTKATGTNEADPFGVLKGKRSSKSKSEKTDKPSADDAKKDESRSS